MHQPIEHATRELYETYHVPVNVQRDKRTYDHFASAHSRSLRQEQLLTAYMEQMIAAIARDVSTRGDCWLLRAIVQQELPAIHLLDRSAIACVYASIFTPDEQPRLDMRSIPYSAAFSSSAGGMRYADRHARTAVIDLRTDAALHPLCHALLTHARALACERQVAQLQEDALALNHRINALCDQLLGQEHTLHQLEQALSDPCCGAAAPAASPERPADAAPAAL